MTHCVDHDLAHLGLGADGKDAADIQSFGFAVATILVIVVNLQVNSKIIILPFLSLKFTSFKSWFSSIIF